MGKISIRKGREGSRWWNERPSSEDVANWFKEVPLHDGMEAERYISGIVLIPQKMKTDEIDGENADGSVKIREGVRNMTYTPYPKVETRVQYFHDLMAKNPNWMGVIEPVGGGENGLPPGFSARIVKNGDSETRFVSCTMQVRVYDRESFEERVVNNGRSEPTVLRTGKTIVSAPPATKLVGLLDYYHKPDPFAMMKAETGAVGRALGMAGMLVVPGAGVATAEDMHEASAMEGRPAPAEPSSTGATLPETPPATATKPEGDALMAQANEALNALRADFPGAFEEFKQWCAGRKIENLTDVQDEAVLRGLVKKAQKTLDDAQKQSAERNGEPEPVSDAEATAEDIVAAKGEDAPPEEPVAEKPPVEPAE